MKTRFDIDDSLIKYGIEANYGLQVRAVEFLPKGDISYAYIITCSDGTKYFLKLFDKLTAKGKESIKLLGFYLPLTYEMYQEGLYKNITYPVKNNMGNFQVDIGPAVIVLFNFIEGRTLEGAYPFSRFLLEKVARGIAEIHKSTCWLTIENPRVENFQIPFEDSLMKALRELEGTERFENQDLQILKEYMITGRCKVLHFLEQLHIYRDRVKSSHADMVLTHGDIWGGNLMISQDDNLHFIDWESAMIAPPEADLRHYVFEDFDYFMEKYKEQIKMPVKLDSNIFGFYIYRSHLANLTNWMSRMLHDNQSSEQNKSDFECITFHCMDRWDSVEEKMKTLIMED